MHRRIHDDEVDTSELVVSRLLEAHCPQWSGHAVSYVESTGSSNTLWRVHTDFGNDVVVRLPRTPGAEIGVRHELELLPALSTSAVAASVAIPTVVHFAPSSAEFPLAWSVLSWIEGTDAWRARDEPSMRNDAIANDMADAIELIRELSDMPAPLARLGARGGSLHAVLDNLDAMLSDPRWSAHDLIDVGATKRIAAAARELDDEPSASVLNHGDLLPGNLLVDRGRLSAIIDWASACYGDPAHDIGTVWAMLDERQRAIFRERLDVDEATWLRGTAIELEQAVGAILYYLPRKHELGDVGARTLERILGDSL